MPALIEARIADPDAVRVCTDDPPGVGLFEDQEIGDRAARFGTVRERCGRRSRPLRRAAARARTSIPELLTWLWHGVAFVAIVRRSISDDGAAMQAVAAAEVLERLLQPGD